MLWLVSAALSVTESLYTFTNLGSGCGVFDDVRAAHRAFKGAKSLCQQQQALQAFGFLGWLARKLLEKTIALHV
jgi:hypothetical protein